MWDKIFSIEQRLPPRSGETMAAWHPTAGIRVNLSSPGRLSAVRSSAGFQPAVSPISNRQAVHVLPGTVGIVRLAGWKHCDTAGWETALLGHARRPECARGTLLRPAS